MSLPTKLAKIVQQYSMASRELRVQALLESARRLPPLPDALAENRDGLEQVHECQTPFFLATEVTEEGRVRIHFDCPPESPTVRGFAGILHQGLDGESADVVLAIPDGFYMGMGLEDVVSPLRLRGMGAILSRLKRQIREKVAG